MPACEKEAVDDKLFAAPKVTVPGPETMLQVIVSAAGGFGWPSSIAAPTKFMRDWVAAHYSDRIRKLWHAENPDVQSVDVIVVPDRLAAKPAAVLSAPAATAPASRAESPAPERISGSP